MFNKENYINISGLVTSNEEMLFSLTIFSMAVDELLPHDECLVIDLNQIPYFRFKESNKAKYIVYKDNGISNILEYSGYESHGSLLKIKDVINFK